MIAYVNGYVCTTPCEAAAARKGHDPFAPPGTPPSQDDKNKGIDGQSAVTFGGVLANVNQTNSLRQNPSSAVTPMGAPSPSNQPPLNLLV